MSNVKVAISIDQTLLAQIDQMVKEKAFPSRSNAIQNAIHEKLNRINRNRLAHECSKLDVKFEQALAEEGLSKELNEWPEY